jgi:Leucine-rich repeat (LRR) protein
VLYLYNNELKTIDVSPLTQLTVLYLYNNELKTIDVSPLTQLRILRLDGNRFNTSVPTAVSKKTRLRCLNLRNNSFSGEMDWLQDLEDLRWLDVRHNAFQDSMPEIHRSAPLEFLGLGSSGFVYNESYILSRWPWLVNHGDHFRSQDVDFGALGGPRDCIG